MRPHALLGLLITALIAVSCRAQSFLEQFTVNWSGENIIADDWSRTIDVALTERAGASFASTNQFLFGNFSTRLKLIAGESSGIVVAFYLTSIGLYHDEIDFEFLGNETGQPYVLHTNLFANGVGGREQRIFLWFDPTLDFHTYGVIWNHQMIWWLVDDVPVRIHRNREVQYPNSYLYYKPMVVASSIFDAGTWATRGGLVPIKWQFAPFLATFGNMTLDACTVWNNDIYPCNVNYVNNTWEQPNWYNLTQYQVDQMKWVMSNLTVYNYCLDTPRYPVPPPECSYNQPDAAY